MRAPWIEKRQRTLSLYRAVCHHSFASNPFGEQLIIRRAAFKAIANSAGKSRQGNALTQMHYARQGYVTPGQWNTFALREKTKIHGCQFKSELLRKPAIPRGKLWGETCKPTHYARVCSCWMKGERSEPLFRIIFNHPESEPMGLWP